MYSEQQTRQDAAERELDGIMADGGSATRIGDEFFQLADLLREQGSLLRSLTNPGRDVADRRKLIDQIVGPSFAPETRQMIGWLIGQHWTRPGRFIDGVESMGTRAILFGARSSGLLAQVGQELFEVRRFLAEQRELRIQLSGLSDGGPQARSALVGDLLSEVVLPDTLQLTLRAVKIAQHGHLLYLLRDYTQEASRMADAQLVTVTAARTLTEHQQKRMQALLERQLGKSVIMALSLDPDLIGGFRIDYGDEAADSSIRTEIGRVHRVLAR